MGRVSRTLLRCGLPLLIVAVVLLCYRPVLQNDFVNWDDPRYFTDNPNYRGLSASHVRWMFTTLYMGHYQPLTWLTHGMVYTLWGMDPTGYHLVNVLLHCANAVLVYSLTLALLRVDRSPREVSDTLARIAAAVSALLFALHPLRVEAVAWGPERQEVLCAFFFLLTLLAYLRMHREEEGSRARLTWYMASIGCFALSLLSKAAGLMLPVVLLALDAYPLRRLARGVRCTPVVLEKIPYIALAATATAVAFSAKQPQSMIPLAEHGLVARVMQAAYGLCFYVWKTVAPLDLSPLYLLPKQFNYFAPAHVFSVAAVIGITAGAIGLRRRWPWASIAWLCYVAMLLPVLGLVQAGPQLVADRYTYLACLPWAVLVAAALQEVWAASVLRHHVRWVTSTASIVAAALLLLGALTSVQAGIWNNSITLWTHALQIEPENYVAYNNRASAYDDAGNREDAFADANAAITLNPEYGRAYYNRGNVHLARGDVDSALGDYNQAITFEPGYAEAYCNRGNARQMKGDVAGAAADFDVVLQLNPQFAGAHYNRANARKRLGDLDGALADFDEALRLNPQNASAYNNRGNIRRTKRDLDAALADYDRALDLNPHYANAYNNRAIVRREQGDLDGAIADYILAIQFAPPDGPYRATYERNLAATRQALADQGKTR